MKKIKIDTEKFSSILNTHADAAGGVPYVCWLNYEDSILYIKSHTGSYDIWERMPAVGGKKKFSIEIDGDRMANFIKTMDEDEIYIGVDGEEFVVMGIERKLTAHFKCEGLVKHDIPATTKHTLAMTLDVDSLQNAIKNVAGCAGKMQGYITTGNFCLEYNGKNVYLVATDNHIIGKQKLEIVKKFSKKSFKYLIPIKQLKAIAKHIDKTNEHVTLSVGGWEHGEYNNGDRLIFSVDEFFYGLNCSDDNFPNYGAFMPEKYKHTFTCDAIDIKKAVTSAAKAFKSDNQTIRIEKSDKGIDISRKIDKSNYSVNIDGEGDDTVLNASHKMLTKIFNKYRKDDRLEISVNDPKSPMMVSKEGDDLFYTFMGVVVTTDK